MTFTVTIDLGNDAMQTAHDVQSALRDVIRDIDEADFSAPDRGRIGDINGNTVGTWRVA